VLTFSPAAEQFGVRPFLAEVVKVVGIKRKGGNSMTKPKLRTPLTRRAMVGGVAAAAVSAPYIRNAEAATTTTWKVQTSWPAGVGLNTFKDWCNSIKE
jgi:hypothetical protein